MTGSPLVGGSKYVGSSKFVSWHPASIERMLKTDAGILRMLILRMGIRSMLGKMLNSLPGLSCPGSWQ